MANKNSDIENFVAKVKAEAKNPDMVFRITSKKDSMMSLFYHETVFYFGASEASETETGVEINRKWAIAISSTIKKDDPNFRNIQEPQFDAEPHVLIIPKSEFVKWEAGSKIEDFGFDFSRHIGILVSAKEDARKRFEKASNNLETFKSLLSKH
jgi:hypothetical protein